MRQGTHGDTFYIISEGAVRITKRVEGKKLNLKVSQILKTCMDYFALPGKSCENLIISIHVFLNPQNFHI